MASSLADHLPFYFLLFVGCMSLHNVQGRESQFFSKTVRYDNPPTETNNSAKEEAPTAKREQSGNGYDGLYSRGPYKIPPATTTNYNYHYDNNHARYNADNNLPSEFPNKEFYGETYNNKKFNTKRYPNDKNYENKEEHYNAGNIPNNELTGGSYEHKKETNTRYPNYGHEHEQYGMSDTRLLENGRYFYDINAEKSYGIGGNDQPTGGNPKGYGSSGGVSGGDGNHAYVGYNYGNNNKNGYEYKKFMEGYQNNQGRKEYMP